MNQEIRIPKKIKDKFLNIIYKLDYIGCSKSKILIYENQVLKIEKNIESNTEHLMLEWLKDKLLVPKIYAIDKSIGYNYLLMSKLPSMMACDNYYLNALQELVQILAKGLKLLWNVKIKDCSIDNNIDNRLKLARYQVENGLVGMDDAEDGTYGENGFKDPFELLEYLENNKPKNTEPSFIHGDYCLPNIFIENNEISGFIDLGRSGIGDKYNDIALAVRSLEHNFGTNKYKDLLYKELGLEIDEEKIRYYILLDELF